jgi:sRNA-binding protein
MGIVGAMGGAGAGQWQQQHVANKKDRALITAARENKKRKERQIRNCQSLLAAARERKEKEKKAKKRRVQIRYRLKKLRGEINDLCDSERMEEEDILSSSMQQCNAHLTHDADIGSGASTNLNLVKKNNGGAGKKGKGVCVLCIVQISVGAVLTHLFPSFNNTPLNHLLGQFSIAWPRRAPSRPKIF